MEGNMTRQEPQELKDRRLARSAVVEIAACHPDPTPKDLNKKHTILFVGTIVVAKPEFCYVIVKRSMIQFHRNDGSYKVTLADGSSTEMTAADFIVPPQIYQSYKDNGYFAAFYIFHSKVPYDFTKVKAVEFGDDVVTFDPIKLAGFGTPSNFDLSDGRVIDADDEHFFLDCAACLSAFCGSPVFHDKGELVGICHQHFNGLCLALTVSTIIRHLLKLNESKTLDEFRSKVGQVNVQQ